MRVLFIFLDGIGLGENNPETNPFARARMPNVNGLLEGRSLLKSSAPFDLAEIVDLPVGRNRP